MAEVGKLFERGKIGPLQLKNRLIMAPVGTGSHDPEGFIQDRTIDFYAERAKGGVGLIIGQSAQATRIGRAPGRSGAWHDKFIPGLAKVASAVHENGGRIAWQVIYHGKVLMQWLQQIERPWETRVLAPSSLKWVRTGTAPESAAPEDIDSLIEEWSEAARRVKDAGFDAVEIHGAHGYCVTQWLSPRDNMRPDSYGGSPENRARFACELISRIRRKVGPDFPVIFRFSADDFMPGGVTVEQSVRQAPLFAEAGADALHVSAGEEETTQRIFPSYLFPDGANIHLAEAIKRVVNIPVITVGKLSDLSLAAKALEDKKADFIALGRPLLADPHLPNKAKEGRFGDIRRCIYCNNCLNRAAWPAQMQRLGRTCTVNPAVLREKSFALKATPSPKRIMVVGGGLAGMEAARGLAERGHRVSLYEMDDRLGGQFLIATLQPHKEVYRSLLEYQMKGLESAGVRVFLKTEVSVEMVGTIKPDAVIVASGAFPRALDVPGADGKNVVQAIDVITGKAETGKRVVVAGGRLMGMEVALQLAQQGRRVAISTLHLLGENGLPVERNLYRELRDRLFDIGVQVFENAPVVEVRQDGVFIDFHKELVFLKADTLVLAVGSEPNHRLASDLKRAGHCVYAIGDCVEARDAMQAVREGAELAREIT